MAQAARPSLAPALRGARARLSGDELQLDVPADFHAFARGHADELEDLARQAAGRRLVVVVSETPAGPVGETPAPVPAEDAQRRLRARVEREPAVQEALDLFGGRVVDVRETK
jgi:hypothetical protein